MKIKRKILLLTVITSLVVVALLAGVSFAWFYPGDRVEMRPVKGSIQNVAAYFNGGNGTKDDPYQIATPVQMYNFAWLQYMGTFNQVKDGGIDQTFFKLTATIDMAGVTLPPIGTYANPFLGGFDGNNNTISNLTVDNEISTDGITDFPGLIEDNIAFQRNGAVDIVGLFGVVGSIGETDYTYDSSANVIQNLYVNNITVKTKTDQSLIGILAGYVNGTVQNVGVIGNTTIHIAAINPLSSYTTNMSDFSLVGYCTEAYKSQHNAVSTNGSLDDSGSGGSGVGGAGTGWGGSIGINTLYSRLEKVYGETSSETAAINTYVSAESRTYNMFENTVEVSYTVSTESSGQKIRYHDYGVDGAYAIHNTSYSYYSVYGHSATSGGDNTVTLTAENAYWIFIAESGPYLNRNGIEVTSASVPTTMWALDEDGHLYTVEPGTDTKYYLSVDTTGASLVTMSSGANQWTLDGVTLKVNGAAQYLSHDGTKWCLQSTGTFAQANSQVTYTKSVTQGRNSYFPINAKEEDNFSVGENNTGYFVGGAYITNGVGDFRVVSTDLYNIWRALGKGSSSEAITYGTDKLQVFTCTAETGGAFRFVKDDYNQSAVLSDKLKEYGTDRYSPSELGLEKYDAARAQLEDILAQNNSYNSSIYGLRFMQSEISTDHLMTAPVVKTNGKTTYNYEMPESCINFQLAGKGKISFFAATVAATPNYFFSLHEIIRNPDNTIKDIKKIQKIYEDGNTYIYEYSDGTFSGTKSAQAALVFDLDWIMNPNHTGDTYFLVQNAVYYFEIPVNAGEYALGAHTRTGTSSSRGAFLLYLDIGANGDEGSGGGASGQTETTMSATAKQYIYPNGVDFLLDGTALNGIENSAAITLPSGTSGDTSFSREGDTITVDPSTGLAASYIKDGITVSSITATPITETVYLKKVAQTTDGVTTVTITKGSSAENATDTVLIYSYTAGDADISILSTLSMPENTSTWVYAITITSTASIDVTVSELINSGFAITINGEQITVPTTITVSSS